MAPLLLPRLRHVALTETTYGARGDSSMTGELALRSAVSGNASWRGHFDTYGFVYAGSSWYADQAARDVAMAQFAKSMFSCTTKHAAPSQPSSAGLNRGDNIKGKRLNLLLIILDQRIPRSMAPTNNDD